MSYSSFHAQASDVHHSRRSYPPPSQKASQVALVTSVRPIRNGATPTR